MLGTGAQAARWQLVLIGAAPFAIIWMFRAFNPILTLFVLLVVLDIGAMLMGADSRSKGDWNSR